MIILCIVSAHAMPGCDIVTPYHGVGKMTVVKKLKEGKELTAIGHLKADMKDVIEETTNVISNCYGYPSSMMTECRINLWYQKTSKARKTAQPLKAVPPT